MTADDMAVDERTALPPTPSSPALLVARGISKTYGSTSVLNGIDLELRAGETLAVLGENGAGKSTLMKIISGVVAAGDHGGTIELDGARQQFSSTRDGDAAGVVLVPQELHVAPHLTIAENMFAAHLPGRFGVYAERTAVADARRALAMFDLDVDPRAPAAVLSPSERRLIVLAAALHRSARVLILDEPTAALTEAEAGVLLEHVDAIRASGVGILYITHRLDELDRIADRCLVLRNGSLAARFDAVPPREELVSAMLGETLGSIRALADETPHQRHGDPALSVRGLSVYGAERGRRPRVLDVDLDVHPGEIVGLYGLLGAGRTELGRALFGVWPGSVIGRCTVAGRDGVPRDSRDAVRRGVALLAEDRKSQGVLPGHSIATNMTASMLDDLSRAGLFIDRAEERRRVDRLIAELGVRPARPDLPITALSGGNQQKVLLGRCLIDDLRVLILDEPTLGVDVGARRDIYRLIRAFARDQGVAVLMISSDVDEIRTEADRVLVMYKGRITGEFSPRATAHDLLSAATGA
jgi:ABC-type sugar transport system ATPase subunit